MASNTKKEIIVYSTAWCPDCRRAKKFFADHRIPYTSVDVEQDPQALAEVEKINHGQHRVPTIIFEDGSILVEPTNAELAQKLNLRTKASLQCYDAIIVGSGPAGLTASIYLGREGFETLVIERAGVGGQVSNTQSLDNFPGFPEGISGAEFADRLARQATRFGVEILRAQDVERVHLDGPYLCTLHSDGTEYTGRSLLFASGANYRKLNVPGEEGLIGINVHFCATCDAAFYKDKKVLVVGGGNSGFSQGLYLTRFARQVDIIEREPQLRASKILQEQVAREANMNVMLNHEIVELKGGRKLEEVVVKDRTSGEQKEWQYDGVFVFVGVSPNSQPLENLVKLDPAGFVITDASLMTAVRGLYAAGDVRSGSMKQAAAAAGEGATAALMMREFLNTIV